MKLTLSAAVTALGISLILAESCDAQGYPFSQRQSIVQNLAHTVINVSYGRPVARGRTLFGSLVPWDTVWHPGADSATVISFSRDVIVQDHELPAGEYSLWLIPRENAPWTVIFNRAAHVFHTPYPGDSSVALRFDVATESASHMETMAIYFPLVLRQDGIMRIHWGETVVPIRLRAPYVPPEFRTDTTSAPVDDVRMRDEAVPKASSG